MSQPVPVPFRYDGGNSRGNGFRPLLNFDKRIGDRYGVDKGDTKIQFMLPMFLDPRRSTLMLDAQAVISDTGHGGANVGLGYRMYDPIINRVFSLSSWYDYDDGRAAVDGGRSASYQQVAISFESLGKWIDYRVNGYLPFGDESNLLADRLTGESFFEGNSLMLNREGTLESAYRGFDAEIGGPLPLLGRYGFSGYIGGYHRASDTDDNTTGISLRFEAEVTDDVRTTVSVSNDDMFGTNVWVNLALALPDGRPTRWFRPRKVSDRMLARVERDYRVVTHRKTTLDSVPGVLTASGEVVAGDTTTESPLSIAFIDPQSTGSGEGTFENPFPSLLAYESVPVSTRRGYGVVLVSEGAASDPYAGLNTGITAFDNQRLLSTYILPTIALLPNGFSLPDLPAASAMPILSNATGGNVITLAGDNTEVAGFIIDGTTNTGLANADGIVGTDIVDFNIHSNQFQNYRNAVVLTNATGTGLFRSNWMTGTPGTSIDGLQLTNSGPEQLDLEIGALPLPGSRGNIATGNDGIAFNITAADQAQIDVQIVGNETFSEDSNGNGLLDAHLTEDFNGNGLLDPGEDLNRNGALDVATTEDVNNNGTLDTGEDYNEDANGNGILDSGEDVNGDGFLNVGNGNGVLNLALTEDVNGNGILDLGEDINNNGRLELAVTEDVNGNGILDAGEDVNEDANNNGRLDAGEDLNGDGFLNRGNGNNELNLAISEDLPFGPGNPVAGNGQLDMGNGSSLVLNAGLNSRITGNIIGNSFGSNTGEDRNLNGVLDPGEDQNANLTLDLGMGIHITADGGTVDFHTLGEDLNGNGRLDGSEDLNGNSVLDLLVSEDFNGNGVLDTEDANANGLLDTGEDLNGNGLLDSEDLNGNGTLELAVSEDLNNNGVLDAGEDVNEDANGNGRLDTGEDLNGDGLLNRGNGNGVLNLALSEDRNGNGRLDRGEDINGNGRLEVAMVSAVLPVGTAPGTYAVDMGQLINGEDVNGNGILDPGEDVNEDANGNGVLDTGEDVNGDNVLNRGNGNGELNLALTEDFNGNQRLDGAEDLDADGVLDGGRIIANNTITQTNGDAIRVDAVNSSNVSVRLVRNMLGDATDVAAVNGGAGFAMTADTGNILADIGFLHYESEDINGNGVLDLGEDINGNGLIDATDLNANGLIDLPVPTDGNVLVGNAGGGMLFDFTGDAVATVNLLNNTVQAQVPSQYNITLTFTDDVTPSQRASILAAVRRWEKILVGDLPDEAGIDDIRINVSVIDIDGVGGALAQAMPTTLRTGSSLPLEGIFEFDVNDIDALIASGKMDTVVLHEVAHALGFGTIWTDLALLRNGGTVDPRFTGAVATREYNTLYSNAELSVPVEGLPAGAGSIDAHWRESIFGTELMTMAIEPVGTVEPLSRVTAGQFADLGYMVNMDQADPLNQAAVGGIRISVAGDADLLPSVISGNTVQDYGGTGIALQASESGLMRNVVVRDNTVAGNGVGNGTVGRGIAFDTFSSTDAAITASLVNNQLDGNFGDGVAAAANSGTITLTAFHENDISNGGADGIALSTSLGGVITTRITNNTVESNLGNGVSLAANTGNITLNQLSDNTISSNGGDGIILATSNGGIIEIPQSEDANGNGILDAGEDLNGNGVLDQGLVSNVFDNNAGSGIAVTANGGTLNLATVADNAIRRDIAGTGGITIDVTDATLTGTFLRNTVSGNPTNLPAEDLNGNGILDPGEDTNGNGVLDAGVGAGLVVTATNGTFTLNVGSTNPDDGNTFDRNAGAGIAFILKDTALGTFAIRNNTIRGTEDDNNSVTPYSGEGIHVSLSGTTDLVPATAVLLNSVIDGNTIGSQDDATLGNAGAGISVSVTEDTVLQTFSITNNVIGNSGGNGISFIRRDDAVINSVTVDDNIVTANSGSGFHINAANGILDVLDFELTDNEFTNNLLDGVWLETQADANLSTNLTGNLIDNNLGTGIRMDGWENVGTDLETQGGTWIKNTITNNFGHGIQINAVSGTTIPLLIGRNGTDPSDGRSLGNLIEFNGFDGIEVNSGGAVEITNNIIARNGINATATLTGGGIDINADNIGSRDIVLLNNTIEDNRGDGVELLARGGVIMGVTALGNTIDGNDGRGVDLLNQATGDFSARSYVRFGDGTAAGSNIITSNGLEGFYVVNTASSNQNQTDAASVDLLADGTLNADPDLVLDINRNTIRANNLQGAFEGGGLVLRVGTSNSTTSYWAGDSTGDLLGNGSGIGDPSGNGVGSNDADFGNGRVNARVVDNTFEGNLGDDVYIESFVSTGSAGSSGTTWDDMTFDPMGYRGDPLARLNLVFTGNTGNSIDVTRGQWDRQVSSSNVSGAFYNDADAAFKSRDNMAMPAGPFTSGTRRRNATRLATRGVPPSNLPPYTGPDIIDPITGLGIYAYPGIAGASTFRVESDWDVSGFTAGDSFSSLVGFTGNNIFGEVPFGWSTVAPGTFDFDSIFFPDPTP